MAGPPATSPPAFAAHFRVGIEGGPQAVGIARAELPRLPADPGEQPLPPLVLHRAAGDDRLFHDWWEAARSGRAKPRTVTVTLLAPDGAPILGWRFIGARPLALSYGPLDAAAEGLLDEVLELGFERIERD